MVGDREKKFRYSFFHCQAVFRFIQLAQKCRCEIQVNYLHLYIMKRKPSPMIKCQFCEKQVHSRGLGSHIRLQHKLEITKTTQVKPNLSNSRATKGNNLSNYLSKPIVITQVTEVKKEYTRRPGTLFDEFCRIGVMWEKIKAKKG